MKPALPAKPLLKRVKTARASAGGNSLRNWAQSSLVLPSLCPYTKNSYRMLRNKPHIPYEEATCPPNKSGLRYHAVIFCHTQVLTCMPSGSVHAA